MVRGLQQVAMAPAVNHIGIAAEDPRNAGPIAHFRPTTPTRLDILEALAPYASHKTAAQLDQAVDAVARRIAAGPLRPDPPLGQPVEAVDDPFLALGAHPDLVEELWRLDETLPQPCRWVFWNRPALAHPQTGVVFAIAVGTLGLLLRLPEEVLAAADPGWVEVSMPPPAKRRFDISPMGPEWRYVRSKAPSKAWIRAAYEFAGAPG
jgi:hypothetical protein